MHARATSPLPSVKIVIAHVFVRPVDARTRMLERSDGRRRWVPEHVMPPN